MIVKAEKEAVDYGPGMQKSHCGPTPNWPDDYCVHFEAPDACARVFGKIRRKAWCKLFRKAKDD